MTRILTDKPLPRGLSVVVLTDLRAESILDGSLDVDGLTLFAETLQHAEIVSVPRLHAKVYAADEGNVILTSGNLTPSGLEGNLECGVLIRDLVLAASIQAEIMRFRRLGSPVSLETLQEILDLGQEIRTEYEQIQRSASSQLRRRFAATLRLARRKFIATQVGPRSANAVFSEALLYVLAQRPMATRELHPRIQRLLPDLCDDSLELVINGEAFGKKWKHHVRNAQQHLKRSGLIDFDGTRWRRVTGDSIM